MFENNSVQYQNITTMFEIQNTQFWQVYRFDVGMLVSRLKLADLFAFWPIFIAYFSLKASWSTCILYYIHSLFLIDLCSSTRIIFAHSCVTHRSTRLSSLITLVRPTQSQKRQQIISFHHTAPALWNSLPRRSLTTVLQFLSYCIFNFSYLQMCSTKGENFITGLFILSH